MFVLDGAAVKSSVQISGALCLLELYRLYYFPTQFPASLASLNFSFCLFYSLSPPYSAWLLISALLS